MLEDYIKAYNKAKENGDTKEMNKIQKDLFKLGVDIVTLEVLAREFKED